MLHGYIPPHRFLPYLSWTEIAALPDRENTVIVLPCRRHRAARPAPAVLGRQRDLLRRDGQGAGEAARPTCAPSALPPITYGKSDEHLHFPGTMTLTGTTLLSTVIRRSASRSTARAFASCCSPTATAASRRCWRWPRANCACATATS
jgi:creatinine amidohydrolase